MKVIFYRILGNDLPPRHSPEQTLNNLAFILKHEPELAGCEKRFVINRIFDEGIKKRLIGMIDGAGLKWNEIPIDYKAFLAQENAYEKSLYITNQNAARNACLDLGLAEADAVLPFDGQVMFNEVGWAMLMEGFKANPKSSYIAVGMYRLKETQQALKPWPELKAELLAMGPAEPQLAVRRGYDIRFNETLSYGFANKVEALMRLGVRGPWDTIDHPYFTLIRENIDIIKSKDYGRVPSAGFVMRLASGNAEADGDVKIRAKERDAGLIDIVARVEAAAEKNNTPH